jgi:hypothetical protein
LPKIQNFTGQEFQGTDRNFKGQTGISRDRLSVGVINGVENFHQKTR